VAQSKRRGGIGKTLMQCLCDIAREWDMQKVMLTVFKGDEIQLSFCQAMFTEVIRNREPDGAFILQIHGVCTASFMNVVQQG
jgi:hypothetical protein